MIRFCFLLYLLIHILGDYYFQGEKLAEQKIYRLSKVFQHNLIYLVIALIISVPFFTLDMLISVVVLAVLHAVIDLIKYWVLKKKDHKDTADQTAGTSYLVDQALHLLCILIVACVVVGMNADIRPLLKLRILFDNTGIDFYGIMKWLVLLLLIFKPANITIKHLLDAYKPKNDREAEGHKNAGAFIGSLERLIILILLSLGQFAAIGLVLTAKSIARYNKIAEDKVFAEYYLLGTLLSTVFVLGAFLIVR